MQYQFMAFFKKFSEFSFLVIDRDVSHQQRIQSMPSTLELFQDDFVGTMTSVHLIAVLRIISKLKTFLQQTTTIHNILSAINCSFSSNITRLTKFQVRCYNLAIIRLTEMATTGNGSKDAVCQQTVSRQSLRNHGYIHVVTISCIILSVQKIALTISANHN